MINRLQNFELNINLLEKNYREENKLDIIINNDIDPVIIERIINVKEILVNLQEEIFSEYYDKQHDITLCITYSRIIAVYQELLREYFKRKYNGINNSINIDELIKKAIEIFDN
jgi:hypothetical protein